MAEIEGKIDRELPESDSLGDQYRAIDKARAERTRSRLVGTRKKIIKETSITSSGPVEPTPVNSTSKRPWNIEMVRYLPGRPEVYRDVDSSGKVISPKPR